MVDDAQAAWLLANAGADTADSELHTAIATAKFWAAEAGHRVAHTAVHVHGGVGIDMDHPVHRYFLAAKQTEFALGGDDAVARGFELGATGGPALAQAPKVVTRTDALVGVFPPSNPVTRPDPLRTVRSGPKECSPPGSAA